MTALAVVAAALAVAVVAVLAALVWRCYRETADAIDGRNVPRDDAVARLLALVDDLV